MAQKPPGATAGANRVTFTKASAERIADAVRAIEGGNRDGLPVSYSPRLDGGGGVKLRIGTFTGSWSLGQERTIKLLNSTATVRVKNWCDASVGDNTTEERYVVFGRASGTNSAVEIQGFATSQSCKMNIGSVDLTQIPGFSAGQIQLLGHSAKDMTTNNTACASLQWFSVSTCSTAAT